MIFRGPESLQYPSPKEFQRLSEMMHRLRTIQSRAQLPSLTSAVEQLVPHQFSACAALRMQTCEMHVGYTNYDSELTALYTSEAIVTDPSIQLLRTTRLQTVSSEDCFDLSPPTDVERLKLDFGIRTCLSVGVRGVFGVCTYLAFSNFDQRLLWKLRTIMHILAPHCHLAYLQATTPSEQFQTTAHTPIPLTAREHEIMRWVAEGKTNWEISMILRVSLNTVKFHLKNVYQKLGGVENRWTAVALWQRGATGLLRSDAQRPRP